MAKKFGKFLLATAAIGSAVAAACYFMQKKENAENSPEDEDYDDFSEDLEEASEPETNYVPLTPGAKVKDSSEEDSGEEKKAPQPEATEETAEVTEEASEEIETEEFFNEED